MNKGFLKNIDWSIIICVISLIFIGMIALYSATIDSSQDELAKQIIWFIISIPIAILVIFIDYKKIAKIAPFFYGIILILLILVLFTDPINGATSWFEIGPVTFQPAEFAKIFVIITISDVIVRIQNKGKEEMNKFLKILLICLVVLIPVILIVKQPDYGTALAFLVATVLILFCAGIDKKYIIISAIASVISLPLLYFFVLPKHAKTRIDVFLNPNLDPRGSGYNVIQSKLAIGAGKVLGMGITKGNQTQLGFLYPKTTDFIFSVIGEEMGFIIACLIIILYIIIITKAINIAKTSKDDLGSYISIGIAGVFLFHMVENIGMTMGLLPITGVPLPFVSYGGSSLLTNIILVAILINIGARRKKHLF